MYSSTSFTAVSYTHLDVYKRQALDNQCLVSQILRTLNLIQILRSHHKPCLLYTSCISAFGDYNDDGVLDPRESLVYVPDSAKNAGPDGAPVVVVFPGSTQAASTFMDCSGWWAVANDEGCVVIIVGQFCRTSAASLTYGCLLYTSLHKQ